DDLRGCQVVSLVDGGQVCRHEVVLRRAWSAQHLPHILHQLARGCLDRGNIVACEGGSQSTGGAVDQPGEVRNVGRGNAQHLTDDARWNVRGEVLEEVQLA